MVLAEFQRLKSDINKLLSQGLSTDARKSAREEFRSLGEVLGLFQLEQWQFSPLRAVAYDDVKASESLAASIGQSAKVLEDANIERLLIDRNEARKQKDFKKADEIRQFLASYGIVIEDKPDGTSRWKR